MVQAVYVSNSSVTLFGGIPKAFYFKGVSVEPLYHFNSFVTFFGGLSLSSVNTSGGITFFGHLYRNWTGNYENTITGAKISIARRIIVLFRPCFPSKYTTLPVYIWEVSSFNISKTEFPAIYKTLPITGQDYNIYSLRAIFDRYFRPRKNFW